MKELRVLGRGSVRSEGSSSPSRDHSELSRPRDHFQAGHTCLFRDDGVISHWTSSTIKLLLPFYQHMSVFMPVSCVCGHGWLCLASVPSGQAHGLHSSQPCKLIRLCLSSLILLHLTLNSGPQKMLRDQLGWKIWCRRGSLVWPLLPGPWGVFILIWGQGNRRGSLSWNPPG